MDDVVDFTPEIRAMAMERLKGYRFGSMFTPPSFEGTLLMPSNGGGANWGGASLDPTTGILYAKAKNNLRGIKLIKPEPGAVADPDRSGIAEGPYWYDFPGNLTVAGGILVNKPPYGLVTAIDLNQGEILWQVSVGDIPGLRDHPLLKGLNLPPMGGIGNEGSVVTAGGLLFVGVGDTRLHALDKDNGQALWAGDLEFPTGGSPMTYRTEAGRQFVIVATGSGRDATLVAFALPNKSTAD